MPKRWFIFSGVVFAALTQTGWCQKVSDWRVYKVADGLPESACISVAISPSGKVLARHLSSESVSLLNGYTVSNVPLPAAGASRVRETPNGQLWTVVPEGLLEFKDGTWALHPVPEIAAVFRSGLPRPISPIPFFPVKQDQVIFLLPDRLMKITIEETDHSLTEVLRTVKQMRIGEFSDMTVAQDGGLWISGPEGWGKCPAPSVI